MDYPLNEAQTKAVRELTEAVVAVLESNILVPADFAAADAAMTVKCQDLAAAFPDIAKEAKEYYYSEDEADVPDWIAAASDHRPVTFDAICSTFSIKQAHSLTNYSYAANVLREELYDLGTYSAEFDQNRGVWQ